MTGRHPPGSHAHNCHPDIPTRNGFSCKRGATIATLALSVTLPTLLRADQGDEIKQLREEIHVLEQKLIALERMQEVRDEAAAAVPPAPTVSVSDKGFTLASADGANSIKLRGLVQLDSRLFFGDGGQGIMNDGFVLRRARIISEGTFARNFSFLIVPEFSGSSAGIVDAIMGLTISPELQFKVGRLKPPVGLEQLQSDSWTFFSERSIVSNLVPNHDLGVLANGDLLGGALNYSAGVVGGVADGANTTNTSFDTDPDLVARIIASPFRNDTGSPWRGLSFGVAGNLGREKTAAGRTAGYKTDGQQTFFSYNTATIADGASWRVSPQFDYRNGAFGALGEYVLSTVNLRSGATGLKAGLQNKAWQLAAGYVLTGEDSSLAGLTPRANFDFSNGTWGAFEIVARYAGLKIDDAAFPLCASTAANADDATSFGLGVNWYLSKAVLLRMDYYQTKFGFPSGAPAISAAPILRQDEAALFTRFQVSF